MASIYVRLVTPSGAVMTVVTVVTAPTARLTGPKPAPDGCGTPFTASVDVSWPAVGVIDTLATG